ncbi:MAG: DUF2780 domain-containing protein [Planctomycetota bacterium]
MELIEQLVSQLGVSTEQAEGGAGALFKVAQEKLGADDFSQVSNLIPGLDDLIGKAPDADAPNPAEGDAGGLLGVVGDLAKKAGFGDAADKLGDLAGLTAVFDKLGLDAGMMTKFASAVMEFLKSKGGAQVVTILQGVLK